MDVDQYSDKVRKRAKIRNRYNQAPHLIQDTNWKVTTVVMGGTLAPAIFKPEKNLVFFQDKIAGAIDAAPGRLE